MLFLLSFFLFGISLSQSYLAHASLVSRNPGIPADGNDSLFYPTEDHSSNHRPVRDLDLSEESSLSSLDETSMNFMEETRARMRQLEVEAEVRCSVSLHLVFIGFDFLNNDTLSCDDQL